MVPFPKGTGMGWPLDSLKAKISKRTGTALFYSSVILILAGGLRHRPPDEGGCRQADEHAARRGGEAKDRPGRRSPGGRWAPRSRGGRYALVATFQRWPSGSLKYPEYPPHWTAAASFTTLPPAAMALPMTSSTASLDGTM